MRAIGELPPTPHERSGTAMGDRGGNGGVAAGVRARSLASLGVRCVCVASGLAYCERRLRQDCLPAGSRIGALSRLAGTSRPSRYPEKKSRRACARTSSGARKTDDGCTVAITGQAHSDSATSPRCWVTRKLLPKSACAAVLPSTTTTLGSTSRSSSRSHGLQARTWAALGFLYSLRLISSWRTNLKCLTTLVT